VGGRGREKDDVAAAADNEVLLLLVGFAVLLQVLLSDIYILPTRSVSSSEMIDS